MRTPRRLGFLNLSPIRTLRGAGHNGNTRGLNFLYIGVHMRSFDKVNRELFYPSEFFLVCCCLRGIFSEVAAANKNSEEEEEAPTRFYTKREHTVEGYKVHLCEASSPLLLDLCSTNKDQIFQS